MNQTGVITHNLPATSQHVLFHTKPPEPPGPDALSPVSRSRLTANTFRQAWDQGGGSLSEQDLPHELPGQAGQNTSYSQETAPTPPPLIPTAPRARGPVVICVILYSWLYSQHDLNKIYSTALTPDNSDSLYPSEM